MKTIAAALLVVTSMAAQATEPTGTLTLACQGTVTNTTQTDAKPEPISMGIIVDLKTEGAVGGFTNLAHINRFKATTIEFLGHIDGWWVEGSIDRVTGDVSATEWLSDQGRLLLKKVHSLKCTPAQRKF